MLGLLLKTTVRIGSERQPGFLYTILSSYLLHSQDLP
jgi:hypothetical protein